MSHNFTDTADREWKLSLDWDLHEQVKEREGVILLSLGDDDCALLARLHTDFALLVNILWILCEDQAEANGVIDTENLPATRQFAKGLGGDVLENASEALVAAVIDFFPNRGQRESLAALTEKARETNRIVTEALHEKVTSLDPASLAQSFIDSAGNSPPSLESTPGDTRLAS